MVMEMEQDVTPEMEEAPPLEGNMDVGGETDPVMEEESEESVVEEENTPEFNGPIPGASLTGELGAETHEKPPAIVDPEEAYDDLASRMSSKEAFKRVAVAAKLGIPVELIARSLVFSGWAMGQYTQDVMLLIYTPVFSLMMKMLDHANVEYVPLAEDAKDVRLEDAMKELSELENLSEDPVNFNAEDATNVDIDIEDGSEVDSIDNSIEETSQDVPDTGLMGMRRE
jgi:hypothetical protein